MSTPRLVARVPSARPVCRARLHKHRLRFHKKGKDLSGKCDAEFTNDEKDYLLGVVFEIAVKEKLGLDLQEGLGNGYEEKYVSVFSPDGTQLEAITYYATNIDPGLRPYEWYKEHVMRGACEHAFPTEYIQIIAAIETIPDTDRSRHEKELSIYQ